MKILRNAPKAPEPPPQPRPHDCGQEIREGERRNPEASYRRFGLVAQCSCGNRFELRRQGGLRWYFGVGPGNYESRYSPIQYWHGLGWSEPQ